MGLITVTLTLRYPIAAAVFLLAGRIIVDLVMSTNEVGLSIGSIFSIGCTGLALWHTRHYLEQVRKHILFVPLIILLTLVIIGSLSATSMMEVIFPLASKSSCPSSFSLRHLAQSFQ